MIVDDNVDGCAPLAKYLERQGHSALCVPNGREALMRSILEPPEVVILDLLMPGLDGPSLLDILRSYLRLQSLPIIVLTGAPDSPQADRVRAAGVNAVLVKGTASFKDIEYAVNDAARRLPA